jgi:Zn-finger nucleic acid-binding protein
MALKCPECEQAMDVHDTPSTAGEFAWIDRCSKRPSCGSWYDRGEYAAIDPMLGQSTVREALIASVRSATASDDKAWMCPRCAESAAGGTRVPSLTRVKFVGVELGLCPSCVGVWAPSGAVDAVIAAMKLHETADGAMNNQHYRSAAAAPIMRDKGGYRTKCCECKKTVTLKDTVLDVDGLLCLLCASERAAGAATSPQDEAPALWTFVRSVLGDLFRR